MKGDLLYHLTPAERFARSGIAAPPGCLTESESESVSVFEFVFVFEGGWWPARSGSRGRTFSLAARRDNDAAWS
jgi:hypothetical protein